MKLSQAIKALQKEGFMPDLTAKLTKQYVSDIAGCSAGEVEEQEVADVALNVLDCYYTDEREQQGFKHGFIRHDWRFGQETDDVVAEFSTIVGEPPLFKQLRSDDDGILVKRDDGVEATIDCGLGGGLQAVADLFNAALEERGDDRRFYSTDTKSDFFVFLFLKEDQLKRLVKVIPFDDMPPPSAPAPDPKKVLKKLLKVEPQNCAGYLYRAIELEKMNEIDLAFSDYSKAITFEPATTELNAKLPFMKAYMGRARLLFAARRMAECVLDCGDVLALATDRDSIFVVGRSARVLRGRANVELKELALAIKDFDKLIADNEYDAEAYFYRAQAYAALGDQERSQTDSGKAVELGYTPRS